MDERRRHSRFKSATILQFRDNIFSATMDTTTKDVSLGGLCFFSEKKVSPGKVIKVRLFYDSKKGAREMKGRVVWISPFEDAVSKGFLVGLMFIR